jgi:hypothetical protein
MPPISHTDKHASKSKDTDSTSDELGDKIQRLENLVENTATRQDKANEELIHLVRGLKDI